MREEEQERKKIVINLKPVFPALPRVEDKTQLDVRYGLIPPYAFVHIHWSKKKKELIYELEEPILNSEEAALLDKIETSMREAVNINVLAEKTVEGMIEYIEKTAEFLISELNLKVSDNTYNKIFYYLFRDFIGLNEIEPLMKDYFIEDIECNGVDTPVYIIHRLYRNMRTNIVFKELEPLASFVEKIAQRAGRYISYASPLLDGSLPDGSRVNATYTTDITSRGPTFSIRKFTKIPWTPPQLVALNTLSPEMLAYFWILIQYKSNILITGGTASGKTTLLNALAFFIPPEARVVSIEDTREINLARENWLPSVARTAIGVGKVGEVDLFALLKNSFRQNPDYVIVGEVRGKEAFVLFQGMASIPGKEKILVLNSNERKMLPINKIDIKKCKAACINPLSEEIEIQPIQALIEHPKRKELVKIQTETGREIIVTEDHSLFTHNNKMQPVEVRALKENDNIIIPAKMPVGYADIPFINLLEYLPNIRIFAPEYIKKAVSVLSYEKSSEIAGIKSISDYYANFKRALPSSLKAEKFIRLMKEAKVKYDINNIRVKFLKKSKSCPARFQITEEFLKLLGYYIAEGSLDNSGKNSRISLYSKNKKILKDMERCIGAVVNCKPKRRVTKGFGEATELSFAHKVLFEFLLRYCGKGSVNKRIPNFIFGLSKERIGNFLSALYDGDGGLSRNVFNYYSCSRQLINDLSYLLLGFGIVGHISKKEKSKIGKYENYAIKFYRADEKREFLKYVKVIEHEKISFSISKIKDKKDSKKKNDIYIDKVKSITKLNLVREVPVWDISVPGKENFIGGFGGIMLHNSGHSSISTMHADSVDTVIKRLETPPIELSPTLVNTLDAVCIMTHAIVKKQQTRKLRSIVEIVNVDPDGIALTNTPFIWNPRDDRFYFKKDSKVFEKIGKRYGLTREELMREFELRTRLLHEMFRRKIFGFERVQNEITEYYKNPNVVLSKYGINL